MPLWVWVLIAVAGMLGLGLYLGRWAGGGVYVPPAPTAPDAPVLSNLSSGWTAGDNPPGWRGSYGTSGNPARVWNATTSTGDQIRAVWTFGTTTTEAWTPLTSDILLNGTYAWPLLSAANLTAGGAFSVYEEVRRLVNGVVVSTSAQSNVWGDTLAPATEAASSWATVTGANKSQYVTVNGTGNLVATGQSGFNSAPISVRSTLARGGKRQFEIVVGAKTNSVVHIGVDDGTDNLGDQGTTNFSRPGLNNSSGVTLKYPQFGNNFVIGVGGTAAQTAASAGNLANGDSLICVTDTVAGEVKFFVRRSGTITQVGSTVTGLSFTSYYANCGFEDVETFTATFGPGQNRTLDSGFLPFDNL